MQQPRACQTCRAAKVKCDQHRPTCLRCQRLQQECLYQPVNIFRDQTDIVRRQSQSQLSVRSRSAHHASPLRSQTSSPDRLILPDTVMFPWLKAIPSSITISIEDQATEVMMSNFMLHPCNHGYSPGYLERLPELLMQSKTDSTLRLCTYATSTAYLAASLNKNDIRIRAYQTYGKALSALSKALQTSSQASSDATLMALLVLDFFELFLGDEEGPFGSHSRALPKILDLRGDSLLTSQVGWSLFRVAVQRLQILQIVSDDPVSTTNISHWIDMLNDAQLYSQFMTHNQKIIALCNEAKRLLHSDELELDTEQCLNLSREMSQLDGMISAQQSNVESTLRSSSVYRPPEAPRPSESVIETTNLTVYHDLWLANEWTTNQAFRLTLLENLIQTLLVLSRKYARAGQALRSDQISHQISTVTDSAEHTAAKIITSAPMLGGTIDQYGNFYEVAQGKSIGAYFLLFPLKTVLTASSVSKTLKTQAETLVAWMRQRLKR